MINYEWNIKIERGISSLLGNIFIYRYLLDGGYEVMRADGTIDKYKAGDAVLPTIKIHEELFPILLRALKDMGVKTEDGNYGQGKLVATERHLEDLRELLKLKNAKPTHTTTKRT